MKGRSYTFIIHAKADREMTNIVGVGDKEPVMGRGFSIFLLAWVGFRRGFVPAEAWGIWFLFAILF